MAYEMSDSRVERYEVGKRASRSGRHGKDRISTAQCQQDLISMQTGGVRKEALLGTCDILQRPRNHCLNHFAAMVPRLRWTDCLFQKSLQFRGSRGTSG